MSERDGQVLLGASDFSLAQKREHAKRIRPLLAEEPFEAELVKRR